MNRGPALVLCWLGLIAIPVGAARAGPQTFNSALPVSAGEFVFRQQFVVAGVNANGNADGREIKRYASRSILGYGVNGRLALFGTLPFVKTTLERPGPDVGRIERTAAGIGDLTLFARYELYARRWRAGALRLAALGGLSLPTGEDDERDAFGRLPRPLQPGSGAVDALGGAVVTYQSLSWELDAQALYRARTRAEGFEFGDVARLDAAAQYRLWRRQRGEGVPGFLYAGMESNLVHRGDNSVAGRRLPDSGGTTWALAPSIQYVTKRWVGEATVQVPVARDTGAGAPARDYTIRFGFRVNF